MKTKQKWMPAALVCALGLVLVASVLLMCFGNDNTRVTFEHMRGDANAWKGFTLTGNAGDNKVKQFFTLRDGTVENRLSLADENDYSEGNANIGWASYNWVIPADAWEDAQANAVVEGYSIGSKGQQRENYRTSTRKAQRLVMVRLPDGSALQMDTGLMVQTEKDIAWYSNAYTDAPESMTYSYAGTEDEKAAVLYGVNSAVGLVELDGVYYFYIGQAQGEGTNALYKVKKTLTQAEIDRHFVSTLQQAKDGITLRALVDYGEAEQLIEWPTDTDIISVQSVEGRLCVVTQQNDTRKSEVTIKMLLIDSAGKVTDERVVCTVQTTQDAEAAEQAERIETGKFFTNAEKTQIGFSLHPNSGQIVLSAAQPNGTQPQKGILYDACRIENGLFTHETQVVEPRFAPNASVMVQLDTTGERLLAAEYEAAELLSPRGDGTVDPQWPVGITLKVYENGVGVPMAAGVLRYNAELDKIGMLHGWIGQQTKQSIMVRSIQIVSGVRQSNDGYLFFTF